MNAATHFGTDRSTHRRLDLAVRSRGAVSIDIFRNSTWAGSGFVRNGRLVDCYATQLGQNGSETEAIYDAIEQALASGESAVRWSADGQLIFTWQLADNG